jgi:hypothetical protein
VWQQGVGPSANASVPTTDINGVARSGASCNPGAFEADGFVAPTVTTQTIGPVGRDYATFTLAEASLPAEDITFTNRAFVFEADAGDYSESGANVSFTSSLVSDATRNVKWTFASGSEHGGDPATGVRCTWQAPIINDSFVIFDGLVFAVTDPNGVQPRATEGVKLRNLVVDQSSVTNSFGIYATGNLGSPTAPLVVENCRVLAQNDAIRLRRTSAVTTDANVQVFNNTVSTAGSSTVGIYIFNSSTGSLAMDVTNNLVLDADLDFASSGTVTISGENNFGPRVNASFPFPVALQGSPYPVTASTAYDPGAGDFALYVSSTGQLLDSPHNDVIGGGVGPTVNANVPTTDIVGRARTGGSANPGAFALAQATRVIGKTIGPVGRDYATFTLAEAAVESIATAEFGSTDLVANNGRIEFLADAGTYDEQLVANGTLTTDATRNVTYQPAAGSEHGGAADAGVILYRNAAGQNGTVLQDDYTTLRGLNLYQGNATAGRSPLFVFANGCVVDQCILTSLGGSSIGVQLHGSSSAASFTLQNSVVDVTYIGVLAYSGYAHSLIALNVTTSASITSRAFAFNDTQAGEFVNCLVLGPQAITTAGTVTLSGSNNFGPSGNAFPSLLQGSPYPITATTSFSTPLGSGDYAVYMGSNGSLANVTGNDVWQQGVGPGTNSNVPTTDINGVARSGATANPGAFEADGFVAPEVLTRTVGTNSRDYSTLPLAEAAVATIAGNADLTFANKRVVFDLYNDSEFTAGVQIIGATSDHERYVTYQAAAGEEHTGDPSTGVRVNTTSSGVPAITVGDSYVRLNRLVIKNLVGNYGHVALYLGQSTNLYGVQVDGCVIDAGTAADGYAVTTLWASSVIDRGSAVHPIVIQNCVLWHGRIGGIVAGGISNAVTTHLHLTNNTFIGCRMAVRAYGTTTNVYDVEFVNNINLAPYLWQADVSWQVGGSSAIISTTNSANNFGAATSAQTNLQWPALGTPNPVTGTTDTNPGEGDWAIYDATTGQLVASPYNSVFAQGVGAAAHTNVPEKDLLGVARIDSLVANPGAYAGMSSNITSSEDSSPASNPVIYLYDKTLGFLIGDRVDQQNSDPYRGKVAVFALHNNSERAFSPQNTSVLYYDATSLEGEEVLDKGNRALNGYGGTREATTAPFYREGGFEGGSYVAATGGYLVSNSTPSPGYAGQLAKPLLKDAVVQRRGQRAFLTSNEVSYLIDDRTQSFRPLGIPRPSTKVSSTPQGVGPIDGFVRYAYRYVTTDGTVGPVFELDPCDATGGVNVFLGAETFGIPSDPAFGLSFGECEGDKDAASNEVECFVVADQDNNNNRLLDRQVTSPGLTLETAFRLPTLTANTSGEESVISQGVFAPFTGDPATGVWMGKNTPKTFPWIGRRHQECCFQFTFRYQEGANQEGRKQTLFCVGSQGQRYKTGSFGGNTHWNLHSLVVSIQPGEVENTSLVVCRDAPSGSHHRDDDLFADSFDYVFIDGHDYTVFVHRGGSLYNGAAPGSVLAASIFNHTLDGTSDGSGGTYDGWALWPDAGVTQRLKTNFWGQSYSGVASANVMWGACRLQSGTIVGKTRVRSIVGGAFSFTYLTAFRNLTESDNTGGQRMYHGRMWRRDFPLQVLAARGLRRFGARSGPLSEDLEIDVAFCPDSSVDRISGGYDFPNDIRVEFRSNNTGSFDALTVLTDAIDQTVFLAYGYDNTTGTTASTSKIPLWCGYSTRNEGSLVIGTGQYPAVEIAKRKWHAGSNVLTFDDFAATVDLSQWTWLTLYFEQVERPSATGVIDVWLERVFIDGNTGEWGDLYNADVSAEGPGGKASNSTTGSTFTNMLFTVGGVPGIDTKFEVETAETRLWNGEVYTAQFGPYLSSRIPPNDWSKLWHYLRFAPVDVNDTQNQLTMDQLGVYENASGNTQKSADAVTIYQNAKVVEGVQGESGGATYFVPFPTPPLSSIRGIQIFRTQVVPVAETFPNGEPNPNATIDAVKACRAAPLYFLSEIPDGTNFYFDSAEDTLLGAELNLTEGLIPGNPGGVFEPDGYLGM